MKLLQGNTTNNDSGFPFQRHFAVNTTTVTPILLGIGQRPQ
jgi:hypothetical protein